MTRGTALVATIARVVQLTGQAKLTNLEADGEIDIADLLVTSSDAIYDRLEVDGIDPTALTNEEVFERAVAWTCLAMLAALGYVGEDPQAAHDRFMGLADRFYTQVLSKVSDTEKRPADGIPHVRNLQTDAYFS